MKVENMLSANGKPVPNQFIVETDDGMFFQSYSSVIAHRSRDGRITLDAEKWNYSKTTSKYRSQFLHESTKDTQRKIDSGEYALVDLN